MPGICYRGVNGLGGGYIIGPVEGDAHRCVFSFILNTDLKVGYSGHLVERSGTNLQK